MMIRHPFQSSAAADLDGLIRQLPWVIAGLVAIAIIIIVILAALLLAATHAKAGECMTLAQVRHEGGYPKFHVRHHRKCWYSAGRDAGAAVVQRHRRTSLTTADEGLVAIRASDQIVGEGDAVSKPLRIEVEMARDDPASAFAFSGQYDPGNMVRAMVAVNRPPISSQIADDNVATTSSDDPVIVCDEFWRTECEPPSEHRQAVAWAIVALVVAFASVAVIVQVPVRRGLRGLREMGS